MFNENSQLVQAWVRLVQGGSPYTREDVPNFSNLRTVVWGILDREEGAV